MTKAKIKETTEKVVVAKPVATKIMATKKVSKKIHLEKYFNNHSFSAMQRAHLKVIFRGDMHTEDEWNKIIEIEFKRRIK